MHERHEALGKHRNRHGNHGPSYRAQSSQDFFKAGLTQYTAVEKMRSGNPPFSALKRASSPLFFQAVGLLVERASTSVISALDKTFQTVHT
jgi:hypothetical protein